MTVQRYQELAAAAPDLDLVPLGLAVEQLRMVKDEAEIGGWLRPARSPRKRSTRSSPASGPE